MATLGFFDRLKALFSRTEEASPSISPITAALLSASFTLLYVLPLHLSKAARVSPTVSRDEPSVIQARVRAVALSCILDAMLSIHILVNTYKATPLETLHLLGWWPVDVFAILKTLLLCSILFVGPLFEGGIIQSKLGTWVRGKKMLAELSSWTGYRNFVVGPISEELVFRSFIIPLHIMAHVSPSRIVFLTPLYFGIAHAHHCYEFMLTNPGMPLAPALIRTLVQFAYTSLFGFFAAFVFLRTGSVYAAVAAHVFCNWMGLPRFWGRIRKVLPPQKTVNADGTETWDRRYRTAELPIVWSVAYYALLFVGAFGFYITLWPLTEGSGALLTFGSE